MLFTYRVLDKTIPGERNLCALATWILCIFCLESIQPIDERLLQTVRVESATLELFLELGYLRKVSTCR